VAYLRDMLAQQNQLQIPASRSPAAKSGRS